jgi:hypothetical protein
VSWEILACALYIILRLAINQKNKEVVQQRIIQASQQQAQSQSQSNHMSINEVIFLSGVSGVGCMIDVRAKDTDIKPQQKSNTPYKMW